MNQLMKRGLALLLVLVLSISLLPAISISASADDISYVTSSSGYIYNWGTRGETATFLSPNAKAFYAEHASYEELSSYTGSTDRSSVPSSSLYKTLQSLMKGAQTHQTSYSETKELYRYTDCQESGKINGGAISSFYSGTSIGPSWDGGWNREHTWPNSKGLGGNDENDIMMLRPTSISENSSRGNTAYGKSSGYYNPNNESNGKYDLRGDVARIFLYVYVRWGNTTYAWGTSGVMESVDVLIEWMTVDPVDTWELGRNDAVESITGTRNVFVDYPELCFLLFGRSIPDGYSSPSGGVSSDCGHNNFASSVVAATCTAGGYTLYTCQTAGCEYSYKGNTVAAKGHSYTSGVCTVCGETEPLKPTYATEIATNTPYKLGLYSTSASSEYYFTGTMTGYYGATDTSYENGVDVYVESTTGGYHIYFKDSNNNKKYINLVISGTHYNFTFDSTATSVYTWDSSKNTLVTELSGEACYIGTYGSYFTMSVLRSSKAQASDYIARFYTLGEGTVTPGPGSGSDNPPAACEHSYVSVVTAPTCTKDGFTTYTCAKCADTYTGNKTNAIGHNYVNSTCTVCGATQSSSDTATISFASTDNRTELTTSRQVWEQNGITVTNDKAASSSNVADYSNPVRFYASSALTIKASGNITTIVFECFSTSYANTLAASIGALATASAEKVTVELDGTSDTFEIEKFNAQVRVNSITVTCAQAAAPEGCQHTNTVTDSAVAATCTDSGLTAGKRCSDCGEVIVVQVVIPAFGHTAADAVEENKVSPTCTSGGSYNSVVYCAACNVKISSEYTTVPALGHNVVVDKASAPTCTETGMTEGTHCSKCKEVIVAQQVIPATGHVDTDPKDYVCDECGTDICIVHSEITVPGVAPTCTETGLTEGKKCSICGEITVKQEIIPVIAHSYKDGECECGAVDPNYVPPTDDTPDDNQTPDNTDTPDGPVVTVHDHSNCETTGWKAFWNAIANFFRRLTGGKEKCVCGEFYE